MSQRRKSTARKRKAEDVDEKESDSSSSSCSSSSSVKKTKTPAKPKTSAKKSAQKKSAAKSSAKKTSLKTGGEMRKDDEEEKDPKDFILRPGQMDQAVQTGKNRLKKETFRKHFRVTNVTGRKKKVYWTDEEVVALEQGYDKLGRKWTEILDAGRDKFNVCRTSVDLKDKYDGMTKNKGKTRVSVKKLAKKEEEEEEQEVTANSPSDDDIYDGDIRIRMKFGKRGKWYKLIGSGHFTYAATIEGCRRQYELPGGKNHRGESIVAGLMQGEESDVLLNDAIGTQIPLPYEKKEKPMVFIIVSKKQSSI